jgi:hypothetical protein
MESLADAIMPVQEIIHTMSIPTNVLCTTLDGVMYSKAPRNVGVPESCIDQKKLMSILSHRRDRAASKYLKDRMKMPKIDGKRRGIFF